MRHAWLRSSRATSENSKASQYIQPCGKNWSDQGNRKGLPFQHYGQLPVAPASFQHLRSHRFQNWKVFRDQKQTVSIDWDHRQSLSIPGPQFTSLYNEVIRPNDLRALSRARILWYSWRPDSELVLLCLCSPSDGMMRALAQHQANNIWPWAPTPLYTTHLHHHPPHREKNAATQKLRKAFLHDQVSSISLNFQRNSIF